jgi:hypothetical protein
MTTQHAFFFLSFSIRSYSLGVRPAVRILVVTLLFDAVGWLVTIVLVQRRTLIFFQSGFPAIIMITAIIVVIIVVGVVATYCSASGPGRPARTRYTRGG